jgi:hypothetical protein
MTSPLLPLGISPLAAPTRRAEPMRKRSDGGPKSESVRLLKIMNPQRNGKNARLPDRLGEEGEWRSGVSVQQPKVRQPARQDLRSRLRTLRRFFVILVRLLVVLFQSARTGLELLNRHTVFGGRGKIPNTIHAINS